MRTSDPVRLGDGLERDESIVFAVRLGLFLLFSRLAVFTDQGVNVGAFLVDLVAEVFYLLTVVLNGVLLGLLVESRYRLKMRTLL